MCRLDQFNQQVLECQDDAFTLAWYLLEDEVEAQAVMQAAVEAAYFYFLQSQANCHLRILQQVVDQFRKSKQPPHHSKQPGPSHPLRFMTDPERMVVVLIDLIGLDYAKAAFIMGCSRQEIGCLLACARWKINDHKNLTYQ